VFEDRMLRRIFGPKRVEVTTGKLHTEAIHNLYVTHIGEIIYSHTIFVRKPEGKRFVKRPRRR
jgi:hypothetical protein